MTVNDIEEIACNLLLKQKIAGYFALSFFDYRHIKTDGKAIICTSDEFTALTGAVVPFFPEGVTIKSSNKAFIIYDNRISNKKRVFWTIAHELGHIYLGHKSDGDKEEYEANQFAAAILMPESVIRFLDCQNGRPIPASDFDKYFSASQSAARRRRSELYNRAFIPSEAGNKLVTRLFAPDILP